MPTRNQALYSVASTMQLSISNPAARILERPDMVWIASGLDEAQFSALSERQDADTAERLCRQVGDASIIRVETANGRSRMVTAWKGLTSCHEVFFQLAEGTEPMVTDHFRNALVHVPPPQRESSDAALCDHFLFRTVPAGETLCRSIRRLGRGERLELDPVRRRLRRTLFHRVEAAVEYGTESDYLDRIDAALEELLSDWRRQPGTVNLFSGGVDSTLIHTYLSSSVPALCFELDRYADGFEAGYARGAAGLLELNLRTVPVAADDYIQRLERLIADTAMPPPHAQLAFYEPLFDSEHRRYVIGEQADAVFGIGLRNLRLAAPFTPLLGRSALGLGATLSAGRLAARLRRLQDLARQLAHPTGSIDGYAGRFGVYTDLAAVERVFGRELVCSRLQARLDSVRLRLEPAVPGGKRFFQHVEMAQMVDFLAEDIMMCFRHLAHAHGKSIVSPFMTGPLLAAALTIPLEHRYLRRLSGKYLLKSLLSRRLPDYPIKQSKGYSHVSLPDLYRDGGLAEAWQRYQVPEPLRAAARNGLLDRPDQLGWNALTLAIWQDRVRSDGHLRPVTGSRALAFQ